MTDSTEEPAAFRTTVPGREAIRVGYVMTHYPRVALTFIDGEIEVVRRHGIGVQPFVMNEPNEADMAAPDAERKYGQSLYLKRRWASAVATLLVQLLRHPIGVPRVMFRALGSAGGHPGRAARRIAHLVQAAFVLKHAQAQGIRHLHAHFGLAPATIAWLASQLAGARGYQLSFGFTIHGYHDFVDPVESALARKARDAAYVLCISDFTRSQLSLVTDSAMWGKFKVARCGVDCDVLAFRPLPEPSGTVRIMALGRLSAEKGFSVLIDAVATLRAQGANAVLVLVGDGPLRQELEQAARTAGIAGAVHFKGELPPAGVHDELTRSDIFCLPSFSEGLPVSIMEAMAVGVPVVTTWIAGIPELAVNGETALTVPPACPGALARALKRLMDDPALAARLAEAARTRVVAYHDREVCGAAVAAILREHSA